MYGFGHGILQQPSIYSPEDIAEVAEMYVEVVTRNIESFLTNKTKVIRFDVADPENSIRRIWEMGGIEGDIQKALQEWSYIHNQS